MIAISEAVRQHLEKDFQVVKENIALIPSGIDIDVFPYADEKMKREARVRLNLGEGLIIGMVARYSDVKGQDILLDVLSDVIKVVPDLTCVLVGEGKFEGLLRRKVEKNNLQNVVKFVSIVNKTAEILPIFDICVAPSRQEGLGLSIMESMAMGIPVVASKVGGIPSLIEHKKTGLMFSISQISELSEMLCYALTHLDEMKGMGKKAHEFVIQNGSSREMVEKTCDLYQELVDEFET